MEKVEPKEKQCLQRLIANSSKEEISSNGNDKNVGEIETTTNASSNEETDRYVFVIGMLERSFAKKWWREKYRATINSSNKKKHSLCFTFFPYFHKLWNFINNCNSQSETTQSKNERCCTIGKGDFEKWIRAWNRIGNSTSSRYAEFCLKTLK